MEERLTEVHLRYILAIYEISQSMPDVSSASVADRLGVRKPTVSAMIAGLSDKNLVVKRRYGKIYLTEQGLVIARRMAMNIDYLMKKFAILDMPLNKEEMYRAAKAAAIALPETDFRGLRKQTFVSNGS